jgi:hypothetical protein
VNRLFDFKLILKFFNKNSKSADKWSLIEEKLGHLLRTASQICFDKGLFSETQRDRYFVSVTEKEIFKGILNGKNLINNALFFVREIEDIESVCEKVEKKHLSLVKKFIDMDKNDRVDQSAKMLLNDLKYKKIPAKLPESNTFKFKVYQRESDTVNPCNKALGQLI